MAYSGSYRVASSKAAIARSMESRVAWRRFIMPREVQSLAQLEDDLVLQREDVVDLAVHFHRPAQLPRGDLHEVRGDPDHRADPLVATHHHPRRAEAPANVDGERVGQV